MRPIEGGPLPTPSSATASASSLTRYEEGGRRRRKDDKDKEGGGRRTYDTDTDALSFPSAPSLLLSPPPSAPCLLLSPPSFLPLSFLSSSSFFLLLPLSVLRSPSSVFLSSSQLRLTLDASHWFLVCERLLGNMLIPGGGGERTNKRMEGYEETVLRLLCSRVDHIHARIGAFNRLKINCLIKGFLRRNIHCNALGTALLLYRPLLY